MLQFVFFCGIIIYMGENMDTNFGKKKLNNKFIACIIYLIITVLMSVVYLLAAVNNQLEINNGTMNPTTSVIVFSCFMIIPPMVWLIVLICRKEIFFNIEQEKNKALKKYESSDLKKINDYVEQLLVNDKLMTILKNFVLTHSIPSWQLEFACLPLKEKFLIQTEQNKNKKYFKLDKWIKYINGNSIYINYVQNFNNDILEENNDNAKAAFILRDNPNAYQYAESIKSQFKELQNLYITLQHQNIIDIFDDILFYYAFLFLIYREKNIKFYEQSIRTLEDYNIELTTSDNELVNKLFNNGIESDMISTILFALKSKEYNYSLPLCISFNGIESFVKQELSNLKEKEKIDNLLNPEKENKTLYTLTTIDLMSGEQFEHFITYLFNNLGYKATNTKLSGDQGIDVLAKKGKTTIAIQTKCYSKPVGNHAIMEAVAGAKYYNADKIMVVTNSTFTRSARELAESNNVILWDRSILKEKLEEI